MWNRWGTGARPASLSALRLLHRRGLAGLFAKQQIKQGPPPFCLRNQHVIVALGKSRRHVDHDE